ncbi:MAG TPA: DUF4097 family beta strand repeat-containing protein [Thermoanaerobaculaceae bacterium]|nr:DUF4097 family beta strand repeat-containing protein [Thermoanaerobaculaceae bacterium]
MTRGKRIALLLIPVALCIAGLALAAEPYRENFDQSYPLATGGRVSLENVNGGVVVNVWDQPTVRVQAVKEAESKEVLDKLRIEVTAAAGRVEIETRYPDGSHGHLSVEYTLTVPKGAALDKVELVNGGLTVSGLGGEVRAELVNGEAKLTGLMGNVFVEAVNGEVNVELEKLDARQRVKLETVNGPIELRLAAGVAAEVDAETVNGHLSNDFGIPVNKHEFVGADMNGSIGTGGGDVSLKTVNGRIALLKK